MTEKDIVRLLSAGYPRKLTAKKRVALIKLMMDFTHANPDKVSGSHRWYTFDEAVKYWHSKKYSSVWWQLQGMWGHPNHKEGLAYNFDLETGRITFIEDLRI